jgi:hypothetical protein
MNDDELNRYIADRVKTAEPPPSLGRWRQTSITSPTPSLISRLLSKKLFGPIKAGALAAVMASVATATVSIGLVVRHEQTPQGSAVTAVVPANSSASASAVLPVQPTNSSATTPAAATTPAPSTPAAAQTPAPPPATSATPAPTSSPPGPAFPKPPLVTHDGHGGFIINGTGSNWWHLGYGTTGSGPALTYSYPDIPSSTTDITLPAGDRCVSVQPVKGGDQYPGHPNRTLGSWSQWVCN